LVVRTLRFEGSLAIFVSKENASIAGTLMESRTTRGGTVFDGSATAELSIEAANHAHAITAWIFFLICWFLIVEFRVALEASFVSTDKFPVLPQAIRVAREALPEVRMVYRF
jgi:hypothetical protein